MCIKDDSFRLGSTNNGQPIIASTILLEIKSMPEDIFINQYLTKTTECEELKSKMQCSDCVGFRKKMTFFRAFWNKMWLE